MMKLGNLELKQGCPRVACSFKNGNQLADIEVFREQGLDIAELRIDLFDHLDIQNLQQEIELFEAAGVPTLLTARSSAEGGHWCNSDEDYFAIAQQVCSKLSSVDMEIRCMGSSIAQELVTELRASNKEVVGSFHDFDQTPNVNDMHDVIKQAKSYGSDIVKIAVQASRYSDIESLTEIALAYKEDNLILIAMGEIGLLSRLSMPSLGSLITFAYVGSNPTAPGQFGLVEMTKLLQQFYPMYRNERA